MAYFVMEDAREYVFGLFSGTEDDKNVVQAESLKFLGSAFFVTKRGDAITAAHVLPPSSSLSKNEHLYAIAKRKGSTEIYKVIQAAVFNQSDLSICRVNVDGNPYIETSFERHYAGTDVSTLGITDHDLYQHGKELRVFKGHITFAAKESFCELSFAIPRGMSGGPVLVGTKCIGFLSANIRSEYLEEQIEEIEEIEDGKEKITFIESKNIINFGIFVPFSYFYGHKSEIFNGKSLNELIDEINSS